MSDQVQKTWIYHCDRDILDDLYLQLYDAEEYIDELEFENSRLRNEIRRLEQLL